MATEAQANRPLPLQGVTVLDFSQVLLGPYASFLLAMAGADVLKVEGPKGEMSRLMGKVSALTFESLNTRKRSIVIDLKRPGGKALVLELVKHVDMVIENFAPGVMDRLGIGAEALMEINPRLVYVSATGYGLTGARRDDVAMDTTIQAMSGLMAATGDPAGPPMRSALPVGDILGGTHLYAAAVTALYDAKATGKGRVADVSMLEAMFPLQASNLSAWHNLGRKLPPRHGNRHVLVAPTNVYAANDGWVALMCASDKQWESLTRAINRPDLGEDERLRTISGRNKARDEIDVEISAWMAERTRDEIVSTLCEARVPIALVRTTVDVFEDMELRERGFLFDIEHPELGTVPMPGSALRFHGSEPIRPQPTARFGADTEDILTNIAGMDAEAIANLRGVGVIK